MSKPLTTAQLNELLRKVYERRMVRVLFDDPTLPWLPESYWREEFERQTKANAEAQQLIDKYNDALGRKALRAIEDMHLADTVTVESVLEEGIAPLKGDDDRLTRWGSGTMARSGGVLKPPTKGNVQPTYDFECYQCGRPITLDGGGSWQDHAGKTRCDLTFVDPIDIATDSYWHDHQPKPWHGEEEDDEDEE